ncbi:MAG: TRAP transporter substrate-binding protein DctP [Desulfatiglandaceae bacterium]
MKREGKMVPICLAMLAPALLLMLSSPLPATAQTSALASTKPNPVVLKVATFVPLHTPENMGLLTLIDKVNNKAKGELVIEAVGPEAIPAFQQFEALRNGVVQMDNTPGNYYGAKVTNTAYEHLIKLTPWELRKTGYYDLKNKILKKHNVYQLGMVLHSLPFYLWLKSPIQKPQELAGKKIRVSPVYIPFIKALGANPVVIPPPDVYAALERGVVDGFCWSALGVHDFGWQEACKYIIVPGFYQAYTDLLINLDTWNRLPRTLQNLLQNAVNENERETASLYAQALKKEWEKHRASGVKSIEFSTADAKWYVDLAYSAGWRDVMKNIRPPELGPKLKEIFMKR